ncbi:MAG: hypothetical protein AB1595_04055 [bacterium]
MQPFRHLLSYSIEDYLGKIELSGSGESFTGKFYISSTTPEGTATFHYSGVDETGSISCYIELGERFIIDKKEKMLPMAYISM